jgi:prepilin-type processing-associated H-X9-DG protein
VGVGCMCHAQIHQKRGERKGCAIGFTTIELLVVIAIIAILLSLLTASLIGARRSANTINCASNLKQWGWALQEYCDQNHGYLPRRGQGVGVTSIINRPTDWFNALPPILGLQPYMNLVAANQIVRPGRGTVWMCPSAVDQGSTNYWAYAMNMGLSVWEIGANIDYPGNIPTPAGSPSSPDNMTRLGNLSVLVFMTDAPGDYCSIFPSSYAGGYNPVPRHNNYANICFADGHVAAFLGSYIGVGTGLITQPDVVWHPPDNTWNSAR